MMSPYNRKYAEYFDIDDKYFPCIDESAIEAGARWDDTYPHDAFIDLLKKAERMLSGSTKRSLWIHGAYGTGKSKCAYTLKRILEVPEPELMEYWNSADNLKQNPDLLQKLIGHRKRGILTAYRYASGDITKPRELFFAIQESIKKALIDNKIEYQGENTLKESVIAWLEEPSHKTFFDSLLKKPEWNSTFTQETTDEILSTLKKISEKDQIKSLMDNIFRLAEKEGITAMSLDADKLKAWLKDIIKTNNLKIVMIWDEFSSFFRQNRNSLDEFQKIVALCQDSDAPFYLVIVTHQTESVIESSDQSWKVVQQRFDFASITLPDNIAFELIGNAFKPKDAAKAEWTKVSNDLNTRLRTSRSEVMTVAHIRKENTITDIMPIHPMAALVLKNIAVAFQANQRSMFDFIKLSNTDDIHAFQWFIENTGPMDESPLLTIDQLWNFFYENGRDNLSPDIRLILDTFPQQQNLREDEKRVLKTILIMQAIDKRLGGGVPLLKPTDQNLSYAFEGIEQMGSSAKNRANGLKERGILILNPIGNGKFAYGAAVLAGDQTKIEKFKEDVKKTSTTAKLVADGKLDTVLALSPALCLRYEKTPGTGSLYCATQQDFSKICATVKDKVSPWHFTAILTFAKDNDDIIGFRKTIKEFASKEEYKHIVFIDALSTPLSTEDYNQYVEFAGMALYYNGNNNQSSKENENKAKQILANNWRNKIYTGKFILYYDGNSDGEQITGAQNVASVLETIVRNKYQYLFDFNRGVTDSQLKVLNQSKAAEWGLVGGDVKGSLSKAKDTVLSKVWSVEKYWENADTKTENISVIKRSINKLIEDKFKENGSISIDTIYDYLEDTYGFAPCDLTAFIIGFLLRDFKGEPYRYSDENGTSEIMTPVKLAEMIGFYMKAKTGGKTAKATYIVMMTPEEKAFNDVTEEAWSLPSGSCGSVALSEKSIREKMKSLGLPVWSLEEVDDKGVYDIIQMYIEFVQKGGDDAHKIALQIGKIAMNRASLGKTLAELLTKENCKEGMKSFLKMFEGGELLRLAKKNGRNDEYLTDISNLFSVEYSNLWNKETGLEQIKNLITEYRFVEATNEILGTRASTRNEAADKWHEKLNFSKCTCEALIEHNPVLKDAYTFLLKVYRKEKILPEQMKIYTDELASNTYDIKRHFENELLAFSDIYEPYLTDLSEDDVEKISQNIDQVFSLEKTAGNAKVKKAADEYRKNLTRTKLFDLWHEKTSSKSPKDWSEKHRTPILKLVSVDEYDDAIKTFETLNSTNSTETEINNALEYLSHADKLYADINNDDVVEKAFRCLLDIYAKVLPESEKVRDELEKVRVSAYYWDTNPQVAKRIRELADAEYNAGGSDKVVAIIKKMDNDKLKDYLIKMIKENIKLGLEIINTDGGE